MQYEMIDNNVLGRWDVELYIGYKLSWDLISIFRLLC